MLPEPTLSFTLPSIHDKTTLECRIYHPLSLTPSPRAPTWRRHAVLFAHPYAPLGGCYDDPVVGVVAGVLLKAGFLVATFNFRGAGGSGGRTSWTAKAERGDYMSVTGFLVHYIHYLDPFKDATTQESSEPPVLILAGYSYGAMITTQIPPLEQILDPFSQPAIGSPEAEIRLRAQHLAEQQNAVLSSVLEMRPLSPGGRHSPRRALGMRVGGNETDEVAQEPRTSFSAEAEEKIRKGVAQLMAKTKLGHKSKHPDGVDGQEIESHEHPEPEHLHQVSDLVVPRVAYVLVSPLQGVITHLATMSFMPSTSSLLSKFPGRSQKEAPKGPDSDDQEESSADGHRAEMKLVQNPTLAAYGDNDVFVPVHKLRTWAKRLQQIEGSKFHAVEISSAGHFWVEEKVLYKLRDLVAEFSLRLINGKPS